MSNVILHEPDCDCPAVVIDRAEALAEAVMEVVGR